MPPPQPSSLSASDAPTHEALHTPTPTPGHVPSCQGLVLANDDNVPPPVPANQDAVPHVHSPLPPLATTLPFSVMVVEAANAAAHHAMPPIDAGPTASKGKGKTKEDDEPATNNNGKGKGAMHGNNSPFVALIRASGLPMSECCCPSLFGTKLAQLNAIAGANLLSPLNDVGTAPNPYTVPDDDTPLPATSDQDDPHFQADLNCAMASVDINNACHTNLCRCHHVLRHLCHHVLKAQKHGIRFPT
ncbi:hypothetical protein K438DRAFT_1987009 [Mycena galopus ATCC 62051]|nr:hypothetical protein K438DRAFT_1987009 [Mycena galopus ATCC 62051]